MREIFLNWHLGHNFGWGILGLNLFCHWANDRDIRPLMGHPITRESLGLGDPLRVIRASRAIEFSNRFLRNIRVADDGNRHVPGTVVDALGNDFSPSNTFGEKNVGRCIFEQTNLQLTRDPLSKYDALLVASQWNAHLVEQATRKQPKIIHEGVDMSSFCPAPKSGLMDEDLFYVFSGGKLEFRKGQDLVLLAFKKFSKMRKGCMLVTAWHSIWPSLSAGFKGRLEHGVEINERGTVDIARWVALNGIDPRSLIDLGLVPNALMPGILREMDVALQPSRAEACTSLPVKEAMACGIPVIAAFNTGMQDLLTEDNSIVLRKQSAIGGARASAMQGWGESDVDEIVAALEYAYDHREQVRQIGRRSREWLIERERTWQAHARELKSWILSL
jgi:glycosyltransferase involved in cell wall biosynthesis